MKKPCLIVLALFFFGNLFADLAFAESAAPESELTTEERVEAYLKRNQRCPNATESFGWICGDTVRMPGSHLSELCTSLDEPLFTGSLSLPPEPSFLGHILTLQYELPLEPLVECRDDLFSSNPRKCATISLFPLPELVFGVFQETPPDPLPDDLPDPPFFDRGHSLEPDAFSRIEGTAVAFYYTRWIGEKPGQPQDQCKLTTRIDGTDIGISLTLPCLQMRDWKTHLGAAILQVKQRIVRHDNTASCDAIPESAVILISPWQRQTIEDLKLWLDLNR